MDLSKKPEEGSMYHEHRRKAQIVLFYQTKIIFHRQFDPSDNTDIEKASYSVDFPAMIQCASRQN